jgi:hypothetical protein
LTGRRVGLMLRFTSLCGAGLVSPERSPGPGVFAVNDG